VHYKFCGDRELGIKGFYLAEGGWADRKEKRFASRQPTDWETKYLFLLALGPYYVILWFAALLKWSL